MFNSRSLRVHSQFQYRVLVATSGPSIKFMAKTSVNIDRHSFIIKHPQKSVTQLPSRIVLPLIAVSFRYMSWFPEQRQTSNIFNGALCKNLREMTKKVLVQEEFCSSVCDQIHIKTPEYYMVRLVVLETHHDQMRQIITVDLSLHGYEPKLLDIASNLYR
uniref:Uncharacterized protein n=1 Tax=Glossina palpalis gambiensis TaxID=67801 RepID=A0A1B0BB28_9MUSC